MGDLVASEAAPSVRQLHATFNAAVDRINDREAQRIESPLTITLGDEFQGLCGSLTDGLAVMRGLRLELLSHDVECRFALGVVRLETPAPKDRAWNMMGPGLADTREKLADKRRPNAYRFHLPGEDLIQDLLEAVAYSITLTELDWTARQREIAIASTATSHRPAELARKLGLNTRTLYKIRSSANLAFYENQWSVVTAAVEALDQRYGLPRS